MRRQLPVLLLLTELFTSLLSFPANSYETVRDVVTIAVQKEGLSEIRPFWESTLERLARGFPDKIFVTSEIEAASLQDAETTKTFDYLVSSASVYAAMEQFAGFSAVASVTPLAAANPNHASSTVIIVPKPAAGVTTLANLRGSEIAVLGDESPDTLVQLREELVVQRVRDPSQFLFRQIRGLDLATALADVSEGRRPAVALSASRPVDPQSLERLGLQVLEPRLNDDLAYAHTTLTFPGWVIASGISVERTEAGDIGAFLRSFRPVSDRRWTLPADYRTLHQVLGRGDDFYGSFRRRSFTDYLVDYREEIGLFLLALIGIVLHMLRSDQLLKVRTKELTEANEARLEFERRYHMLERSSLVGQISSIVAHEIRQPLTAVSNYASGLKRRLENGTLDEEQRQFGIKRLVAEGARANKIVEYVQGYVREAKKDVQRLDLSEALGRMALGYTDSAGECLLELRVERDLQYPFDRMEFEIMMRNLVSNALEASRGTPDAGKVVVACGRTAEGGLAIEVSDEGPAISDEAFRKLSTPLNTSKIGGLGLGLSVVRLMAESYGGHLTFNRRVPRGLSATVLLPPPEAEASVAPDTHVETTLPDTRRQQVVLRGPFPQAADATASGYDPETPTSTPHTEQPQKDSSC